MNNLYVLVKKYYDRINGNTYHSIQFEINNNIFHSGIKYGYEDQFKQTLKDYDKFYIDNSQFIFKDYNIKYIVIDNCKKRELKVIHNYK